MTNLMREGMHHEYQFEYFEFAWQKHPSGEPPSAYWCGGEWSLVRDDGIKIPITISLRPITEEYLIDIDKEPIAVFISEQPTAIGNGYFDFVGRQPDQNELAALLIRENRFHISREFASSFRSYISSELSLRLRSQLDSESIIKIEDEGIRRMLDELIN